MKYFEELGNLIDANWHKADFAHDAFPEICASSLKSMPAHREVSASEVAEWGLLCPRLPHQHDPASDFAEPPVTTFVGRGFLVAVNFWITSTTSVHNHAFSGAFQVLEGGSLETRFRFSPERKVNAHFLVGKLEETSRSVLSPGDTTEIVAGRTIHSLFHLDSPSATVVIRTREDPGAAPQLSYLRPRVAYDPLYEPSALFRRRQLLSYVASTRPDRLVESCLDYLKGAETFGRFAMLRHCSRLLPAEAVDVLLERARPSDPDLTDLVASVIEDERREASLVGRRASVKDPDLRFFLAVLLNVRGRNEALALVRERFPERDPAEVVLGWVRALADHPGTPGQSSTSLGFSVDKVFLAALDALLRDYNIAQLSRTVEGLVGRPINEEGRAELLGLQKALVGSELFRYFLG